MRCSISAGSLFIGVTLHGNHAKKTNAFGQKVLQIWILFNPGGQFRILLDDVPRFSFSVQTSAAP